MQTPRTSPIQADNAADTPAQDLECPMPKSSRRWLARVGVIGVLFFLIKGLAWLIVPAVLIALNK